MKKHRLLLPILFSIVSNTSLAQAPSAIPFQAVARSANGNVMPNKSIALRFSVIDSALSGPVVYQETFNTTTNSLGLFNVELLRGIPTSGTFDPIKWNVLSKFIRIEIDTTGSSTTPSFILLGTQQLLSVPFALYANQSGPDASKADKVIPSTSGNFATLNANGNLTDSHLKPGDFLSKDNTTVYTPSGDYHPATKKYVDDQGAGSYIHRTDDGVTIYSASTGARKRFGIGSTQPDAPLGILGDTAGNYNRVISMLASDTSQRWDIVLKKGDGAKPSGLSFASMIDSYVHLTDDRLLFPVKSRLFIAEPTGQIGLGTEAPSSKLTLVDSVTNDDVAIEMQNKAATSNKGWKIGHINDNAIDGNDATLVITENNNDLSQSSRMIIRPGGNVGVNELSPDTKLHVTRLLSDPNTSIDLNKGSGIAVIGPITNNIVFDYQGIQARSASTNPASPTFFDASELHINPLGGDILIHGNSSSSDRIFIIKGDGKVGVGTVNPSEKLHVNGAIIVGNSSNSTDGTIRYTGTDFEGRKNGAWTSLTTTSVTEGFGPAGNEKITYNPDNAKVGIGVSAPSSALQVDEHSPAVTTDNVGVDINNASTASGTASLNRVGLKVTNQGTWSSNSASKNIGIYVSSTGQSAANSNLAAVLNGNVVVGSIQAGEMVGSNGQNVLVLQNGVEPTSAPNPSSGIADNGVQVFSASTTSGSVFTVMNGNGDKISLSKQTALTAADNSSVGSSYGTTEAAVINNMRTRINELETKLKALGILQ